MCDRSEVMPFTCTYCGRTFCGEHRLPENHGCTALHRGLSFRPAVRRSTRDARRIALRPSWRRTSGTELKHLTIAVLVFFIVEALRFPTSMFTWSFLTTLAVVVLLAFAAHEVAHKLAAQHYGFWAEFRLDPLATLLSLATAIPVIPFKIIAPGAVTLRGTTGTRGDFGKVALAGPLVNIAQAVLFSLVPLHPSLALAVILNTDLALFNLLPFSVLDGRTVFDWNRLVWAGAFVASLALWLLLWR
jgi:Zn-dependent protease